MAPWPLVGWMRNACRPGRTMVVPAFQETRCPIKTPPNFPLHPSAHHLLHGSALLRWPAQWPQVRHDVSGCGQWIQMLRRRRWSLHLKPPLPHNPCPKPWGGPGLRAGGRSPGVPSLQTLLTKWRLRTHCSVANPRDATANTAAITEVVRSPGRESTQFTACNYLLGSAPGHLRYPRINQGSLT